MLSKTLAGALGASILALGGAASAQAATFTVNNTNNSGPGSLRSAINAANGTAAADTIRFAIGAGVQTITPTTMLPTLTQPVKINGYTQPGAAPATATSAAQIKIVLDATNVGRGLDVGGDGMEIRGLDIQRAQDVGIFLEGSDNVVAGNYIGTGVNGSAARPNANYGIQVFAQDNQIGGPNVEDRNVLSGNGLAEVYLDSGTGHVVEGNYIGSDAAGAADISSASGVDVESSGSELRDNLISAENTGVNVYGDNNTLQGNQVGTDAAGTAALANSVGINVLGGHGNLVGGTGVGNVISGNDASGVQLLADSAGAPSQDNTVKGNQIGVDANGAALPNGGFAGLAGVTISGSDGNTITGNTIAENDGSGVELLDADNNSIEANTINDNGSDGVTVDSGVGNAVLTNSIHDNGGIAIDLEDDGPTANDADDVDTGANNLQNGPEIQSASTTGIAWELDSEPLTRYRLEVFTNPTCTAASRTEAETFAGSTDIITDANGNASATTPLTLPAGTFATMTATKLVNVLTKLIPPTFTLTPRSTSEVSPCELVS
jgi:parallel beta-helix repeat protein